MSRLDEHRQTKYRRQLSTYIILLAVTIIFLATIGFKMVIGASIFIANLANPKPTTIADTSGVILAPPTINNMPSATNSARIRLAGQAQSDLSLNIYVNGEIQKELITDEDDFETEITLSEGTNEVYVELVDEKNDKSQKSTRHTVLFKSTKPKLTIDSPKDQDKTNKDEITVSGSTEEDATVTINGAPVVVTNAATFAHVVRLRDGENKLEIIARDEADNTETITLTLHYSRDF